MLGIVLVIGGSAWYSQIQYQKMIDREKTKAEQDAKDRAGKGLETPTVVIHNEDEERK